MDKGMDERGRPNDPVARSWWDGGFRVVGYPDPPKKNFERFIRSLKPKPRPRRGNCYVATEALFHILGGRRAGWTACVMRTATDTHWFLRHKSGLVVDPSRRQFRGHLPDYSRGRGTGFLTRRPSRRARVLIDKLTWQYPRGRA